MNKKENKAEREKAARDERLQKIRTLITAHSEDAAKVLKMWLDKSAEERK